MEPDGAAYDSIGRSYALTRQPDPRIASAIRAALGDAKRVINIGAGTGSYEPRDLDVLAVEPSTTMIAQRHPDAAPAVLGTAEALPVADQSFDAAMAILTVHHWHDRSAAFAEIRRVARKRAVVFACLPGQRFWLHDYFPGIAVLDAALPSLEEYESLGRLTRTVVPIPDDCRDGFLAAYWRRPWAYLNPSVRANMSAFPLMSPGEVEEGVARLAADLSSGRWLRCYDKELPQGQIDLGYRIIRAEPIAAVEAGEAN